MSRCLSNRGHSVRVAICGKPGKESSAAWVCLPLLHLKGLRLLGFWTFGFIAFIWQMLRFQPDVVLLDVMSAGFALPFLPFCRKTVWILDQRFPITHSSIKRGRLRANIERSLTTFALHLARHHFDGLTVITEYFRQQLIRGVQIPQEQIAVWGSGVDPTHFFPNALIKSRINTNPEKFVLVQHGEFSFNRGLLETVRALNEPGMEKTELILTGSGPAELTIRQAISELGLQERVHLPLVSHADIPHLLAECDCLILPYPVDDYWNCNHPIKLAEGLAMGKVIICTPLAITRELGPDPSFLELIPDNKPSSIADGVQRCMNDPKLAERGKSGARYIQEQGTWQIQADRLLDLIGRLRKDRNI